MTDNLLTENQNGGAIDSAAIPEKFRDPNTGELRTDALLNSYLALEKKLSSTLPKPETEEARMKVQKALGMPTTHDEYCIDCSHGLFEPDTDVNQRLHAKGLTQEQMQEVYDLAAEKLVPMITELAADFQADREVEKLINHFGGKEAWKQVSAQLMAFGKQNVQPEVFANLSSSFEGVMALYKMMSSEEPHVQNTANPVTGKADDLELQSMMRDPKYWRDKDPATVNKVTEGFKNLYSE